LALPLPLQSALPLSEELSVALPLAQLAVPQEDALALSLRAEEGEALRLAWLPLAQLLPEPVLVLLLVLVTQEVPLGVAVRLRLPEFTGLRLMEVLATLERDMLGVSVSVPVAAPLEVRLSVALPLRVPVGGLE